MDRSTGSTCDQKKHTRVTLSITTPPHSQASTSHAAPSGQGIRFRVPAWAQVELHQGDQQVLSQLMLFPQFGAIQVLQNEVHGRKNQLVVELSASTGMLTRVQLVDERNYSDVIDAIGEGSSTLLDAAAEVKATRSANEEAAATAPLDAKQRLLQSLEFDRQIACYEAYGGPCE